MVDFGKIILDRLFHSALEGHFGMGARAASALELDFDHIFRRKFYEFDVTAILLQVWTDLVDDGNHFLFKGRTVHALVSIFDNGGKDTFFSDLF